MIQLNSIQFKSIQLVIGIKLPTVLVFSYNDGTLYICLHIV
jgi:hypothetical protein